MISTRDNDGNKNCHHGNKLPSWQFLLSSLPCRGNSILAFSESSVAIWQFYGNFALRSMGLRRDPVKLTFLRSYVSYARKI